MFGNVRNTYFNGQAVTYNEIGNPITFGSKSFEWCGRQLERITDGDNTYVYAYNTDGDRVSKTVNGVKTEYFYNGSILAGQKTGDETLIFMYDNNGDAFGFIYNGEEYYYIKNVQNDIVAIADKNGSILTINQDIPLQGIANSSISFETKNLQGSLEELLHDIRNMKGIIKVEILGQA